MSDVRIGHRDDAIAVLKEVIDYLYSNDDGEWLLARLEALKEAIERGIV